jgi:hypothetical protein
LADLLRELVGKFAPSGEQLLFLIAAGVTLIIFRATTPFSLRAGLATALAGLLITVPLGGLLTHWLLPGAAWSVRVAFIGPAGLAATAYLGFLLGHLGWPQLYVPTLAASLAAWLWLIWSGRRNRIPFARWAIVRQIIPWTMRERPTTWVVLSLALLCMTVASPLMAPLRQATANLYLDYAYVDAYYHTIRAQILSAGAPAGVWPDLAGVLPLAYPDFFHFWLGQIQHISRVSINDIYFMYAPMLMLGSNVLLLYAVGKTSTGSRWGGYLAVAIGQLIFLPNPYDPNLNMRSLDAAEYFAAYKIHFFDLRYNLSLGAGWQIVTAIILALLVMRQAGSERLRVGVLTLASLILVALVRIRPHFFLVMAPPFLLIVLAELWARRQWRYGWPLAVFVLTIGLIYWETTHGPYNAGTTQLGLLYGPYGERAAGFTPLPGPALISSLPAFVRPLAGVFVFIVTSHIGFTYTTVLLLAAAYLIWKRRRPSLVDVYMVVLVAGAGLAAAFIGLEAWRESGGNWGGQAVLIVPRLARLLAIAPLYHCALAAVKRFPILRARLPQLSLGLVTLLAVMTWRGAEAALVSQSQRAYPILASELQTYAWMRQNTAGTAVVAADPDHLVNSFGETVATTNFLSGMTERAAYLQRVVPFNLAEVDYRRALIGRLLESTSADEIRQIVADRPFDYLLVYSDKPSAMALTCCLTLVNQGQPQIFELKAPEAGSGQP